MAYPEVPVLDPERKLPASGPRAVNPQWNQTAKQIGWALGRAANRVREMPLRARRAKSDMRERFEVIRGRSREQGADVAARVQGKAKQAARQVKARARENLRIAHNRAERLSRERPVEIIVAACVAAFIAGMLLRIWRSNRA